MTRNARRMANRRAARTANAVLPTQPVRPLSDSRIGNVVELMQGPATRRPKPRNTWQQRGWSDVSPFYFNLTTIDSRWDR